MNKFIYLAFGLVASVASPSQAQSYTDIFESMPNMTLEQQYSALLDYQKANPYFGNTYIQLGVVCEKIMAQFDPLRENDAVRFWADNATLFFDNLKVYYKKGDVKSSVEYYENLHIPYAGRKAEDEDLWRYVENHKAHCKNHRDTTTLIFNAIEQSRYNYNMALFTYKEICNDYSDFNDLLLRNDAKLDARMKKLGNYIDLCVSKFAEFKALVAKYPILRYNQFYDFKSVETFRLDGLTNSNFYDDRFVIWDFRGWIDSYYSLLNKEILPIRKMAADIDAKFQNGREEYEAARPQSDVVLTPAYDDLFIFRLGRFDNSSLLRELFAYLDATRELVAMAGDSLGRNVSSANNLTLRKMRHLYRMVKKCDELNVPRQALLAAITDQRVARFADFFSKNYGGVSGLRNFVSTDASFCSGLIDKSADNLAAYVQSVAQDQMGVADVYNVAGGSALPELPLWVSLDPKSLQGKAVTTQVACNRRGEIANVAGYLKANNKSWFVAGISNDLQTKWFSSLKNVNSVTAVTALRSGCLVLAIRQLKPVLIRMSDTGAEVASVPMDVEVADRFDFDGVSGRTYWVAGLSDKKPMLSATDSLGVKQWSAPLDGFQSVDCVYPVADGFLVIGASDAGYVQSQIVSFAGVPGVPVVVGHDFKRVVVAARASADEIGLLVSCTDGSHKYLVLSDKGALIK